MKAAPITREERAEIRLGRYRKRAAGQRRLAEGRPEIEPFIVGGRTQAPNIRPQGFTETREHYAERIRIARKAKVHTKRRNTIARASRQRNRR